MSDATALSDLIDTLPLPTLAIDGDERICALNSAAQELVGTTALGRHFVTVLRQPTLVDAVETTAQDSKTRVSTFLAGDIGNDTTYDVHVSQIAQSETLILSFQDVTHMAQAGQMRRDFVANVSHELRTPLTALMGFIETLMGPARDDGAAQERFLGIMSQEAGRMNRLVGDLLSLSRVEAQERVRPTDPVDLIEVLHRTLRNLNPVAVDNDVTLVPEFEQEKLALRADGDQLLQVFTNIIENAIKYGGENKRVWVTTRLHMHDRALRGPAVHITVRDEGPGIDNIHLPRLTERFYRADSHRSRALGGTGLGLAIVKHILSRHRGRLKIRSELGQGTEFTVILPMDAPVGADDATPSF